MKKQNEIKKTLSQAKVIAHIKELLETEHGKSRAKLAHYLCKEYNFFDPAGKMQAAGCIKALSTIEKQAGLETFYNFKPKTNKTEKVNLSTGSQAPAWESFIQDKTQSYQIITFPSLSLGTSITSFYWFPSSCLGTFYQEKTTLYIRQLRYQT